MNHLITSVSNAAAENGANESHVVAVLARDLAILSELGIALEDTPNGMLTPHGYLTSSEISFDIYVLAKMEIIIKQLNIYVKAVAAVHWENFELEALLEELGEHLNDVIQHGESLVHNLPELTKRVNATGPKLQRMVARTLSRADEAKVWAINELLEIDTTASSASDSVAWKVLERAKQLIVSENCSKEKILLEGAERVALSLFNRRKILIERSQHLLQQQKSLKQLPSGPKRIFLELNKDKEPKICKSLVAKNENAWSNDRFVNLLEMLWKSGKISNEIRQMFDEERDQSEINEFEGIESRFKMFDAEEALLFTVLNFLYIELENGRIIKMSKMGKMRRKKSRKQFIA